MIPPRYQDLYDSLDAKLTEFGETVEDGWNGRKSPVLFSSEALCANGNRGLKLLEPGAFEGVLLEIDRLESLGVGAVNIALNFPLLYKPYWDWMGSPDRYRDFLNFYRELALNIHDRDLKLVIDNCTVFTGYYSEGSGLNVSAYYKTLDFDELVEGRARMAVTVTGEVLADCLNLGSEPDTQASITGHEQLKTPGGWGTFVGRVSEHIRCESELPVPIGAGVGTWVNNGTEFIDALALAGVDTIDLHVYPVNYKCLVPRLEELVACAESHGKRVSIGEAWLQKRRDSELGGEDVASSPEIFSRDAFSFWAPLDQTFLGSLVSFAHWKDMRYFSAFWSRYFWAYLEYSECEGMTPDQIITEATRTAGKAMAQGLETSTASAYRDAIASANGGVASLIFK